MNEGSLTDENGDYEIFPVFNHEIQQQNEILLIKNRIRKDPSILNKPFQFESKFVDQNEFEEIFASEREFLRCREKQFSFSWNQFLYELFDFDRDFFKYLRTKPVEYYLEKDIVENYVHQKESEPVTKCPNCDSDNTAFGYAIDYKRDVLYLVLSFLIAPMYLIRKNTTALTVGTTLKKMRNSFINLLRPAGLVEIIVEDTTRLDIDTGIR